MDYSRLLKSRMEEAEHVHPSSYPPIETVSGRVDIPEPSSESRQRPSTLWPQCLTTLASGMGAWILGTAIGWSSVALPPLEEDGSVIPVDKHSGSLIGSLLTLGALFGSQVGGQLMGRYGRKTTLVFDAVLVSLSYLILASAQNVWMLYIGRFCVGLCGGAITVVAPSYIAETSSPHVRGLFGSCFQVLVTVGVLYIDALGATKAWRWLSVACIAMCVVWIVLLMLIPESPSYLLAKKNYDEARKALQFLRGHPYIETEIQEIQEGVEDALRNKATLLDLGKKQNLKPLIISMVLMIGQQLSGVNAVLFYTVKIFQAADSPLDPNVETIIVALIQFLATVLGAAIIDKAGRRILLFLSSTIMTVTLFLLGLFFWLKEYHPDVAKNLGFLPVASLSVYIFAFSIGFGPIPWLMMSELFSPNVKEFASAIVSSFNWMLAFIVTMTFQHLLDAIHEWYTYWMFALIMVLVFAFCVFFVPETKGKSLEEIQQYFRGDEAEDEEGIVEREEFQDVDITDATVTPTRGPPEAAVL